jgi:hypothetical protein
MRATLLLVVLLGPSVGCYKLDLDNGQLLCSATNRKCPSGMHCACDNTCWKAKQDPSPLACQVGPHSRSLVSSGVRASSQHYKASFAIGTSAGSDSKSSQYEAHTGIVGATERK